MSVSYTLVLRGAYPNPATRLAIHVRTMHLIPMPAYGFQYNELHQMQQHAAKQALAPEAEGKTIATLIMAWCRAEQMKREMRGLPPLKAVSMRELADMKLEKMRRAKRGKLTTATSPLILDVASSVAPVSTMVDKTGEPTTPSPEPTTVTAPPPPTEAI